MIVVRGRDRTWRVFYAIYPTRLEDLIDRRSYAYVELWRFETLGM